MMFGMSGGDTQFVGKACTTTGKHCFNTAMVMTILAKQTVNIIHNNCVFTETVYRNDQDCIFTSITR